MQNHRFTRLFGPAMIIAVASVGSRVLGVLRDHLFAKYFGATGGTSIFNLDTYYAAFRIPDFLYQLLIFGTISSAFIPLFSEFVHTNKKEEGWKFANNILNTLSLVIGVFALISFIISPWIVPLFVPGFTPEKIALTVQLTQIMLLSPIFFGVSSIFQSIHNTHKIFISTALVPILYNFSIIGATILFGQKYGVYAIAWGVVLGAILQCIPQLYFNRKIGYKYSFIFDKKQKEAREMFRMILPRIAGLSALQINLFIDTLLASFLGSGSIVLLNYAINLNSFPIGVIGISIAIVGFSTLTQHVVEKSWDKLTLEIQETLEKLLLLLIPATVGIWLIKTEMISFILQSGKFLPEDTVIVSSLFGCFAISLFAQGTIPFLGRIFYANKNTIIPVRGSFYTVIINIILSTTGIFIFHLNLVWLAIANTIANMANFFYLTSKIHKVIPEQKHPLVIKENMYKIACATGIMFVICFVEKQLLENITAPEKIKQLVIIGGISLTGIAVYFKSLHLLRYKKIAYIFEKVKNVDQINPVN